METTCTIKIENSNGAESNIEITSDKKAKQTKTNQEDILEKVEKEVCSEKSEKSEKEVRLIKRKHNEISSVHSANEWEKADLGDDDRKNKFLKLMGAAKKEHKGKIVIGETISHNARTKEETEQVEDALEGQYRTSLGLKLSSHGHRRHLGLGFQKDDEDEASPTEKCEEACLDNHILDQTTTPPPIPATSHSLKFGHFVQSDSK